MIYFTHGKNTPNRPGRNAINKVLPVQSQGIIQMSRRNPVNVTKTHKKMKNVANWNESECLTYLANNYGLRGVNGTAITRDPNKRTIDNLRNEVQAQMNYNKLPEFFKKIDFSELRTQKTELLEMAERHGEDVSGIINLIDALQDFAVDELHIPEIHVFDFEMEDKREGYNG